MTNKETEMRHPASRAFLAACEGLAEAFCKQLGVSGDRDDAWWITPGEVFAFQAGEMFTGAERRTPVLMLLQAGTLENAMRTVHEAMRGTGGYGSSGK